jgi:pyruvate,orthophosphate dikinase
VTWVFELTNDLDATPELIGGKAHGLVVLRRLGLRVPPGFFIGTAIGQYFHRYGRLPDGLDDELAAAVAGLEAATGRRLGAAGRPLVVSVRSGAAVSMPGMMTTILNLGLTAPATDGLARESGDRAFADDARRRFLAGFAAASGRPAPDDAHRQLALAVAAVFASWDAPRARTYRQLHDIRHDLGTAVTVQAMMFGNRDERSAAGVAFSRDPTTGERVAFGEVLFGHQGDDVVSGRSLTRPLRELVDREPTAGQGLVDALSRLEAHYRDASYVEFTVECGQLWLLQARAGGFAGPAAVRVATDLVDEGTLGRDEALLRVSPHHLGSGSRQRISDAEVFARGTGASSGVAVGRVATTAEAAVRMVAHGPVILVRPETSPLDLPGLAAAAGVVTARGGPASHAAIVARSMGKPAVVGIAGLVVGDGWMRAGARTVDEGTLVTIDGAGGEVVIGTADTIPSMSDPRLTRLLGWADDVSGDRSERPAARRLGDAHAALRGA